MNVCPFNAALTNAALAEAAGVYVADVNVVCAERTLIPNKPASCYE